MSEEIQNKSESVPVEKAKAKVVIPPWAIKKVRDDHFSVFVEQNGVRVFLASTNTVQEAETAYVMYAGKA